MADLFSGSGFQSSLAIADPGTNEPTYLSPILFSFLPAFAWFNTNVSAGKVVPNAMSS